MLWQQRFTTDDRVTVIRLGPRLRGSRDPDDDLLLSVAQAGKVECLVTNDRDLLELPLSVRKRLRFKIVTPRQFVQMLAEWS